MKRLFLSIFLTASLVAMDHKRKASELDSPPISSPSPTITHEPEHPKFICPANSNKSFSRCSQSFTQLKDLKKHLLINHSYTQKKLREYCALKLLQG